MCILKNILHSPLVWESFHHHAYLTGKEHHEYHYINEFKTWKDAQSYCRKNHSDLATISNMEDNNIALKSKTNSSRLDRFEQQ